MSKVYKKGYWRHSIHCVKCDQEMSDSTKMYSSGRCPYCGHKGRNAVTIVDTYERAYRNLYMKPLWMFWQSPVREYKN